MYSDLSIYIPAYNAENTIKKCVDSVLSQKIKPVKILVVNDCSTDDTLNILSKYNGNIDIITNKKNMGVSYSMNVAINHLQTRFIGKIDADVELKADWSSLLLKSIEDTNVTLIGGKMYEKYIGNIFNYWRSIRLKQNWGDMDIKNPFFVFGCNNILDTKKIDSNISYRTDHEYYKTNGEDIEFSKFLKNNNLDTYYDSGAICYHLQNDNGFTLANRYWRYVFYGDGLKKRNFFKTIKNLIRQLKRTLKWTFEDILKFNFRLIPINFIIFYYFVIIDLKFYIKNKNA
tara:strand:- start:64 stop:924 length:861 start_codon:yes stop_codon:yes gene_type:complete